MGLGVEQTTTVQGSILERFFMMISAVSLVLRSQALINQALKLIQKLEVHTAQPNQMARSGSD